MPELTPSTRLRFLVRVLIVFVVVFDIAFLWQKFTGAHVSEFGAHPDEGAHCVTGLFVRDGIVATAEPLRTGNAGAAVKRVREFTAEYRAHYPRVMAGFTPPAFPMAEGVWTLSFGTTRLSFLLFMAALAAITGTILFEAVYRRHGIWAASGAAVLWTCLPQVRESYSMLMPEMMSALLVFGAALAWGGYLDRGKKGHVAWFAFFAIGAALTQVMGFVILPMAIGALVMRGGWKILARLSFWVAWVFIAGVVGGWYAMFPASLPSLSPNWEFTRSVASFYGLELARSASFGVAIFAVIGYVAGVRKDGVIAALGSLVMAVFAFYVVVPLKADAHFLIPATPALVLLAVAGLHAVARHRTVVTPEPRVQARREILWVLLLALLAVPSIVKRIGHKAHEGFAGIAAELVQTAPPLTRVLVCSDAVGEGMFISELAMRDQRPNFYIERGSKTLADPRGRARGESELRARFLDDSALLDHLVRSKIGYVVLDVAIPEHNRASYHDQLRRVIADNTGLFWKIVESPIRRDGEDLFPPLRLYRIVRDQPR